MNEEDLLTVIKMAAVEAVEATKPAAMLYGEIISLDPLKIKLDQKLTLRENFLIVTKEIRPNLQKGKVLLIRMQGGQRYAVLGTL